MDRDRFKFYGFVCLVLAVLMFVAIGDREYGYYTFLRWITFIGAGSMSLFFYSVKTQEDEYAFIIPAIIAILWNPIIPIYMYKGTWTVFNVIAAVYFIIQAFGSFDKATS